MTVSLQSIYERRLAAEALFRNEMWKTLCHHFFQKYFSPEDHVLEVAGGYCEFINNIKCKKKSVIDLNPDVRKYAKPEISVHLAKSSQMDGIADAQIDKVFVSNFFEHISREEIVATIKEIHRVLKPGGMVFILQPNIRFCAKDYWMFFDHITPIDDRALVEVLELNHFNISENIVKFLPYTTKSRLPKSILLIKIYLAIRPLWSIFGQQSLIIASKN